MLEILNEEEKEISLMLMQGQNCRTICEWLGIDYKEYVKIKKNIFKKLKIRKITHLITKVIEEGLILIEL